MAAKIAGRQNKQNDRGSVQPERPRARRYSFSANIEMTAVDSEATIKARTCDLSLFGCYVKIASRGTAGTKIRVRITYRGATFTVLGQVAHVRENGMGLQFSEMTPKNEIVLEIWMAELRDEVRA